MGTGRRLRLGESIPGDEVAWRSAGVEIRVAEMRPKAAGVGSLNGTERGSQVREMNSRRREGRRIGTRRGVRPGGCCCWRGSTGEEEVLGRRLGVELLSFWIEEGAGSRELREARSVVGSLIRWSGWKGGLDQIWLAGG